IAVSVEYVTPLITMRGGFAFLCLSTNNNPHSSARHGSLRHDTANVRRKGPGDMPEFGPQSHQESAGTSNFTSLLTPNDAEKTAILPP
ncbi:MAG: hypothetical protein AABZ10_05595, partial [Nitrospirota bacterium]